MAQTDFERVGIKHVIVWLAPARRPQRVRGHVHGCAGSVGVGRARKSSSQYHVAGRLVRDRVALRSPGLMRMGGHLGLGEGQALDTSGLAESPGR